MTAAGVVPPTERSEPTCPDARILVVDDGGANVELLERVLSGAGYTHVRGFTDRTSSSLASTVTPPT